MIEYIGGGQRGNPFYLQLADVVFVFMEFVFDLHIQGARVKLKLILANSLSF